jgi:hypothetical protein
VQGYRKAIQDFRRDPARGFQKLEEIGAVREVAWSERAQAVEETYAELGCQGRTVLVVCIHRPASW